MVVSSDYVLFYVVFVAPGFIAVMTAISLAAIESEYSSFTLLVWSLVGSLVIDTIFISVFQWQNGHIQSFEEMSGLLFNPYFRIDYIFVILGFSIIIGMATAGVILLDIPGRMRRLLQIKSYIQVNPRQPWANFMREGGWIRIKTKDNELYQGVISEWSRADRSKEIRIAQPHRYRVKSADYEPVGGKTMLFLKDDIQRVLMVREDDYLSLWQRLKYWLEKRLMTIGLSLFLTLWYVFQRVVAAEYGRASAEWWFYFTANPSAGWIFAPISHNLMSATHLLSNIINLLIVGIVLEPRISRCQYLKIFTLFAFVSTVIPAIISNLVLTGPWLVAGASGGIYGLWAFLGISQRHTIWPIEKFEQLAEGVIILFGLGLIVIVPITDLFSDGATNMAAHITGIFLGYIIGYLYMYSIK